MAGFVAVAPDFLSPSGGTPANEDAAREAIGKLDLAQVGVGRRRDARRAREVEPSSGKVGAVGFCWGGGFVNRLAVAAGDKLDAGGAPITARSPPRPKRAEDQGAAADPVRRAGRPGGSGIAVPVGRGAARPRRSR